MTAAPGPQQPDEVRPKWPNDREWVPDDEVTCMYCQRYKNRVVCRCGDPNPPVRPAAPSAQPDEWRCTCPEDEAEREATYTCRMGTEPHSVGCPRWGTAAQPVRDTGEGRR